MARAYAGNDGGGGDTAGAGGDSERRRKPGVPGASVTYRQVCLVRYSLEQEMLRGYDTIVWQFPWHWCSVPGVLKEWMDQVLTYGFAYGAGGDALHGKRLQLVLSTGGPEAAYTAAGHHRFTMVELLRPLEATAHLCGL